MPTSSIVPQTVTNRQPQSFSFQTPHSFRPSDVLISPLSWCALGTANVSQGANIASTAYPASSRVLAYPFEIADYLTVVKVWWLNGATATTDSCDVGVYTEAGTTLLVSGGSTAIAGANIIQEVDCTDTLLAPGRYWCAYVQGGTTATPHALPTTAANLRSMGCAQMAGSGSTLGATFTPAANASAFLNIFGISARIQVA
jgi:hypothetical protein